MDLEYLCVDTSNCCDILNHCVFLIWVKDLTVFFGYIFLKDLIGRSHIYYVAKVFPERGT